MISQFPSSTQDRQDARIWVQKKSLYSLRYKTAGLSLKSRQPVNSLLAGRHASRLRGRGLSFEELRQYRSGDDIRTMDWKVTNRTKKPYVRVYNEERERQVVICIDQSLSLFFGSSYKMKSVTAAESAALAAWTVNAGGDCVGALLFNDSDQHYLKPRRGEKAVLEFLTLLKDYNHRLSLDTISTDDSAAGINRALQTLLRQRPQNHLLIVISDMQAINEQGIRGLRQLCLHNDVVVVQVYDKLEEKLPDTRGFVVSDGRLQLVIDAQKPAIQQAFAQDFLQFNQQLRAQLRRYNIPVLPITTDQDADRQLRRLLGQAASGASRTDRGRAGD